MRRLIEYPDMYALMDDLRKEGLFEKRASFLAEYDRAKKIEHIRLRIVACLGKEKQILRSELIKKLRLDRVGKDIVGEALNQLFVSGIIYVTRGPIHGKGGRRGVMLVLGDPTGSSPVPPTDCPVVRCAILGPHTHGVLDTLIADDIVSEDVPEEFGAPQRKIMKSPLHSVPYGGEQTALMPSAILEEVQSNPSSEIKVPQPKTLKSALVSALTAGK